jgi:hypothetical protein
MVNRAFFKLLISVKGHSEFQILNRISSFDIFKCDALCFICQFDNSLTLLLLVVNLIFHCVAL